MNKKIIIFIVSYSHLLDLLIDSCTQGILTLNVKLILTYDVEIKSKFKTHIPIQIINNNDIQSLNFNKLEYDFTLLCNKNIEIIEKLKYIFNKIIYLEKIYNLEEDINKENNYGKITLNKVEYKSNFDKIIDYINIPYYKNDNSKSRIDRFSRMEIPFIVNSINKYTNNWDINQKIYKKESTENTITIDTDFNHKAKFYYKKDGYKECELNDWWMKRTKYIIPNNFKYYENNCIIEENLNLIPLVFYVKIYMTDMGDISLWSKFKSDNMEELDTKEFKENQRLENLYIEVKYENKLITNKDIIEKNILNKNNLILIYEKISELFNLGQEFFDYRNLILVESSYKFGINKDNIIIHNDFHSHYNSVIWDKKLFKSNNITQKIEDTNYIYKLFINNINHCPLILKPLKDSVIVNNYFMNKCKEKVIILSENCNKTQNIKDYLNKNDIFNISFIISESKDLLKFLNFFNDNEKKNKKIIYIIENDESGLITGLLNHHKTKYSIICFNQIIKKTNKNLFINLLDHTNLSNIIKNIWL
tara:strand:- start:306 stop:1904 length:1599 start_codon:yes stop_codon:yes gene_type:complete